MNLDRQIVELGDQLDEPRIGRPWKRDDDVVDHVVAHQIDEIVDRTGRRARHQLVAARHAPVVEYADHIVPRLASAAERLHHARRLFAAADDGDVPAQSSRTGKPRNRCPQRDPRHDDAHRRQGEPGDKPGSRKSEVEKVELEREGDGGQRDQGNADRGNQAAERRRRLAELPELVEMHQLENEQQNGRPGGDGDEIDAQKFGMAGIGEQVMGRCRTGKNHDESVQPDHPISEYLG